MSTARDLNVPKELEKFRVNLLNSALKTAIIAPGKSKPSISSSKFAGAPYLPVSAVHPKDVHGRYMLLLAQINLSDVDIGEPFPSEGMLQFFIPQRCYEYVKINTPEKKFFVRYYPSILNPSQLTEDFSYLATCDYATFPIEKEQSIQFHSVIEPVSATDYRLAQFFNPSLFKQIITDDERSFHDVYLASYLSADHKIGGYPYFIEKDFREVYRELQQYDILLLQIISNDAHGIMWGDSGVMSFFINSDKLMQLDFSDIYFHTEDY